MLALIFFTGCTSNEKTSASSFDQNEKIMEPKIESMKDGKVIITKYYDFLCGYCQKGASNIRAMKEKYGDKIEVQLKHFVIHPTALESHRVMECANQQGKGEAFFFEYFKNYFGVTDTNKLTKLYTDIALDTNSLETCLKSDVVTNIIKQQEKDGRMIGVQGTPYYVINNRDKIRGHVSSARFESLIDQYLQ